MKTLTDHQIPEKGFNDHIGITAGEPDKTGASHNYTIDLLSDPGEGNPGITADKSTQEIRFQKGPILENGVNGVSNEALLAIVIDRLRGFQSGPFACDANHNALIAIRTGLQILKDRTSERLSRGVEGTSVK
jgi:hypothetical protein